MSDLTPKQKTEIEAQVRRDWGGETIYLRKADFRSAPEKSGGASLQIEFFGWQARLVLSVRRLPPPGKWRIGDRIVSLLRRGSLWARSRVFRKVHVPSQDFALSLRCTDL